MGEYEVGRPVPRLEDEALPTGACSATTTTAERVWRAIEGARDAPP